jgi:hypothetical protein
VAHPPRARLARVTRTGSTEGRCCCWDTRVHANSPGADPAVWWVGQGPRPSSARQVTTLRSGGEGKPGSALILCFASGFYRMIFFASSFPLLARAVCVAFRWLYEVNLRLFRRYATIHAEAEQFCCVAATSEAAIVVFLSRSAL